MIYVEMLGRMGNQMFSYAFARKIQIDNPNQMIATDFSNFEHIDESWIDYLDYFDCSYNHIVATRKTSFLQKMILRLYFTQKKGRHTNIDSYEKRCAGLLQLFGLYIYETGFFPFKTRDFNKNKLLIGYFESSNYFDDIKPILKKDFDISGIEQRNHLKKYFEKIDPNRDVCVGIRKWSKILDSNEYNVCSAEYYYNAIRKIKTRCKLERIKLYIFTEDPEWAKENYPFEDETEYITSSVNGEIKPWEAMCLMMRFKYYIIANSSFFWWGQYLSKYEDRVTVAPAKWRGINFESHRDIYQKDWLLVDVEQ